jgi:hypothetical protein
MVDLEARVEALEAKVFANRPKVVKPAPPEHIPDISVAEAKKLGDVKWRKLGDDRFTAVDKKTGKRYSITTAEHAQL